jgi:pilus assembly protein CpaE
MSPVAAPISLMLVADSSETCERIASALLSAPAFYRIERVTSDDLVGNNLPSQTPLALVDGNLRAIRQAQAVRQLNATGLAVVALVDSRDVQTLQEVVLAGAAALVATPFVDTQLWETVATALTAGSKPMVGESGRGSKRVRSLPSQGTVVALYGPKGGSGTSVLAANLAITLQGMDGRGVALMEVGEGVGSQDVLLNLRSERTLGDLLARFDPGDTDLLNEVLAKHTSGLRVLLAPASPGLRVPPDLLEQVIEALQEMYDYVVIDLHTAARASAMAILSRAQATLVIITPEITSLHHGRLFIETVEAAMPDVHLSIVLNRSTLASGVPGDAIRRHLKMQIACEIPDDPGVVTASVNRGVPFVAGQPRSGPGRAVVKLANDLTSAERQPAAAERAFQPSGRLSRLMARGRA